MSLSRQQKRDLKRRAENDVKQALKGNMTGVQVAQLKTRLRALKRAGVINFKEPSFFQKVGMFVRSVFT